MLRQFFAVIAFQLVTIFAVAMVADLPLHARDFGAVGDGVADDTVALQGWLSACESRRRVCFLDAGDYRISKGLKSGGGLRLFQEPGSKIVAAHQ